MYSILNPKLWPAFVRHLRLSAPETVPTLMVAACWIMAMAHALRVWGLMFSLPLLAAAMVMLLLTAITSLTIVRDCLVRMLRFRQLAWWRQRWWFELARITLLLALLSACLSVAVGVIELTFGFAWFDFMTLQLQFAFGLGCAFLIACSWGFLLAILNRRRPAGRAYACVHYFYVLGIVAVGYTVIGLCGLQLQATTAMLMGVAACSLIAAIAIKLRRLRSEVQA